MIGFGQEVKFLCHDRVFYVATEFGWGQGFLCYDMADSMSRQGSTLTGVFLVATENSLSQQGLAFVREFSCCDREFDVVTRLDKTNSFSVATV